MSVFLLLLLLVVVLIPRCEICTACSLALEVVTSVWLLALNRQNVAFRPWLKAYLPSSHKYWSVNFGVVLFQCAFSVFLALKFTKTIEMHLKRKSTSWDMLFLCLVSLFVPSAELENALTARRASPVNSRRAKWGTVCWCSRITISTIYKRCGFQPQFNILMLNKDCTFLSLPVGLTRSRSLFCP